MCDNTQQTTVVDTAIDQLLSLRQAAEYGGFSISHLRNLLSWGKVKGRKLGTDWFTTKAAVDKYKELGNKPGPKPQKQNQ